MLLTNKNMNVCVIGATGKLGRSLMRMPNTVACDVRFEQADLYQQWFADHPNIDTIWHVARACKSSGVRRNHETFLLEQNAMSKLLETRAKECRFVYASTKVVYGITSEESTPLPVDVTARCFTDKNKGIFNFPEWKKTSEININSLNNEHLIYAMTKLACEHNIVSKCDDYKIIRIWDLI
jgi:nucleoside-diphosphate-sugar epimerase